MSGDDDVAGRKIGCVSFIPPAFAITDLLRAHRMFVDLRMSITRGRVFGGIAGRATIGETVSSRKHLSFWPTLKNAAVVARAMPLRTF